MKVEHPEHTAMRLAMQLHNPERGLPHWSDGIDWPADRWDPMLNAPVRGYPILHLRVRDANGRVSEPVHYACGDGDGMMPAFDGWFRPLGKLDDRQGFVEVDPPPVEWQPLRAGR